MTIKDIYERITNLEFRLIVLDGNTREYVYYGTKKIKLVITTDTSALLVSEISVVEIDSNLEIDFWDSINSGKSLPWFFYDLKDKLIEYQKPKKYLLFKSWLKNG